MTSIQDIDQELAAVRCWVRLAQKGSEGKAATVEAYGAAWVAHTSVPLVRCEAVPNPGFGQ